MKILFIARATLYTAKGGDTVQMESTANALKGMGVEVNIKLCLEKRIDYSSYDLIHFFNIIRPADIIYHIDKSKKPFVVSPIYVRYDEIIRYSENLKTRLLSVLGNNTQEFAKCIARSIKNGEGIMSWKYLFLGHKKSIEYILKKTAHLLPNSQSEYNRLKKDFNHVKEYDIIPNAVDTNIFHSQVNAKKIPNSVLCVARIEPQKNQLNIIRALKDTHYHLTIVGDASPNNQSYFNECIDSASSNTTFIRHQPPSIVAELYNKHKVHILASWFETTGLSSLEAAASGCNIVVTAKGDTLEYFNSNAIYCEPNNIDSIRNAVATAMNKQIDEIFSNKIIKENNWQQAAMKTIMVYKKVLGVDNVSSGRRQNINILETNM